VAHATTLVHVQPLHLRRCLKSCFGQACATGELFFAGECEACPDGGSCDGSDQVSCQTTFYKFHPTPDIRPVCHQCPAVRKCFCKKYRIMTNNGERDSRVPHNSYENVTYSSRKQSPDDFGVQPQEQQQESVRQDEWRHIFSTEHKNMNQEHAAFALSNRTSIETNTPSKHIQSTHTHTHTHTHRVHDDRSMLYHACARFGKTIEHTPCANTAHANLSCTKRNWGNQILHCLLSREPRRLRQMLILMMLVEI